MKEKKKASDISLLRKFRKGDATAFEELVHRHEAKIYFAALRYTRNPEDAQEVAQDVLTTLYRKGQSFAGKAQFTSWLYRVVANASFMKLRKRKVQSRTVFLEDQPPTLHTQERDAFGAQPAPADITAFSGELREILQGAIERLPDEYGTVYVLRDVDGMSNEEVAEILQLSVPAVKSRLHRARCMLQKKLKGYYLDYTGQQQLQHRPMFIQDSDEQITAAEE